MPVIGLDGAGDLAEHLARAFAVPDDRPVDLARVSQYVATMQGSGPLYDELHTRFEAAVEPGPLQRFLARLPTLLREHGAPHQLIVTTNYDLALERAFEEAGEELDIVAYVATGTHRGRFWHRPPGEPPRPIDVPNTYATELDLDRRTILLKLHGAVDPLPEREWESFVITEDDYIDYLGRSELTAVVPVALAARLRRSHFLFLGYEMADWNLRLILNRIWGERPVAYRSWAVQRSPSPLAQAFWRRFDVAALDVDPLSYVELLERRLEARMSATPESPYKGLTAFEDTELDALLFFGRERETEIVVANLIASRLTVLYGPSGVGKSSLLGAAVARSLASRLCPSGRSSSSSRAGATTRASAWLRRSRRPPASRRTDPPSRRFEHAQSERDVYLVLDQAEEYFLYHADDGGPGSFAEALPALLAAPSRINVLVSLREDSLAKLDRFTGRVPGLFANTLRLDRLDRSAARAAIVGPLDRYARAHRGASQTEPELIERVLDEVGAGQIEPALGGTRRDRRRGGHDADRGAVSPARDAAPVGRGAQRRARASCASRLSSGWAARSTSSRSTSRARWTP